MILAIPLKRTSLIPSTVPAENPRFDSVMKKKLNKETDANGVVESPTFKLTVIREEDAVAAQKEFKEHVITGLSKPAKALSSMYFYDDRGSGTSLDTLLLF